MSVFSGWCRKILKLKMMSGHTSRGILAGFGEASACTSCLSRRKYVSTARNMGNMQGEEFLGDCEKQMKGRGMCTSGMKKDLC